MKKIIYIFIFLAFFSSFVLGDVLNEIDNPSAYGMMMGGAIYNLYGGPQSIAYNPAGIAMGNGGFFFSHIEHYLGVVRNDFLSGSLKAGNLYFGGAMQTTRPVDINYSQYIMSGGIAYKMNNFSIGTDINEFLGTDIINGFSMDIGGIFESGNYSFAAVLKNALASITWQSTPLNSIENYPAEVILGAGYANHNLALNAFANLSSGELGVGSELMLTKFFSLVLGYKCVIGSQLSNAISVGTIIDNYLGFDLFVSYTFQDSMSFGQLLSPFTVSMNYNFGG